MKIKDVIVSEATPKVNKGTAAGYKGTAGAQAIAQASGIKDVNQIKAGQTINIPGVGPYTVKPGDTLDKIAAANKVGAQPAAADKPTAAAPAADAAVDKAAPSATGYNAITKTFNAPAADKAADAAPAAVPGGSDGTTQDIERLKQLATGGDQPAQDTPATPAQDAMAGADAGDQQTSNYTGAVQKSTPDAMAGADATADQTQTSNYTGVDQRTANARDATAAPPVQGYSGQQAQVQQFGVPGVNQGQGTQPARDASTVPDAARGVATTAPTNPDTGLSTVPGQLQSRGGPTNVKTASQDEYAWRAKNPNWNMTGAQYPGAGNWDPKTGRSKKDIEQGQKNADAVKGFFNKLNPFAKKEPTVNVGPGSPNYQANPAIDNMTPDQVNQQLKQKESVDLDRIRKLSGLR